MELSQDYTNYKNKKEKDLGYGFVCEFISQFDSVTVL